LKNAAKGTFKMHAIQNVCHIGVFIEYAAKEHSKCMPFKMYALSFNMLLIDKAPTILSIA
jgi:hypothetical protein